MNFFFVFFSFAVWYFPKWFRIGAKSARRNGLWTRSNGCWYKIAEKTKSSISWWGSIVVSKNKFIHFVLKLEICYQFHCESSRDRFKNYVLSINLFNSFFCSCSFLVYFSYTETSATSLTSLPTTSNANQENETTHTLSCPICSIVYDKLNDLESHVQSCLEKTGH